MDAAKKTAGDDLVDNIFELLSNGGSLGMVYEYNDSDYEVVYSLGYDLYNQGRYEDALKAFGFLVIHNQMERRYANAFASALQMMKMYKEAIQYYSMASVMDLEDPMPTFHTAECMIPLGMFAEARQALTLVLQQSISRGHAALHERAAALVDLMDRHGAHSGAPTTSASSTLLAG